MKKGATIFIFMTLFYGLLAVEHAAEDAIKQHIFVEKVQGLSDEFIKGVDISSLGDIEKAGGIFYNAQGAQDDLFVILKEHGVNWVRLRVWNDPIIAGRPFGDGNNSVENDLPLAVRAKKAGLKLLIDFHYSDTWADPGKQYTPKEWRDLNAKELNKAVERFTKTTLETFIQAGARPEMVQIGNELNNGFMWPLGKIWADDKDGAVGGFKGFTDLLKSAAKGVRSVQGRGEAIKIAIHLADGGDNELYRAVFDQVKKAKVDYDIIGLSFYTYWHGTYDDLKANMKDLSKRYKKDLVVMETAYAFTTEDGDAQGNLFKTFSDETIGYRPSVQGQATATRDIIETIHSVGGIGVFYWEPAWIPVQKTGHSINEGNAWENQAMFDFNGRALPSLAVWNLVSGKGEVHNSWGGSAKNGSDAIPYALADSTPFLTKPSVAPSLPKMIKVIFTDDSERLVAVNWDSHDWKSETKIGRVKIKGSLKGYTFKPEVEVEISNKVNLITDPSWETGKLGEWKLNGNSAACFVENNKGNARTGKWTYKYWLGTGFKSILSRDFTGIENGTYTLSIWAMGGGGEKDIRLIASDFDGTKKQLSAKIENTGWLNWKQYSIQIPVSNNSLRVSIYLDTNDGNWGNFDDVELYKNE